MKKEINFTKSEANALRNITGILIGYINNTINEVDNQEQLDYATVLIELYESLKKGETKFSYSKSYREFFIHVIKFWYNGVGLAVYHSDKLFGPAGDMYRKHYQLVPGILKKLKHGI